MSVYHKLHALNITLPKLTPPVAAFEPFLFVGNLLFLSGHIAKTNGEPWVGQLGGNLTTAQGKEAARAVAIDLLGTLHAALSDLDRLNRIVKLMVLVNSAPGFTEQHLSPTAPPNFSPRSLEMPESTSAAPSAPLKFPLALALRST